jgi:hypothetical protein
MEEDDGMYDEDPDNENERILQEALAFEKKAREEEE